MTNSADTTDGRDRSASVEQVLLQIEHDAWTALTVSGVRARAFYDDVLADEVLMLFPGGMVIDDRSTVVDSMDGADWSDFVISDARVLRLSDDSAVLAYRVEATRGDGSRYDALLNSTYRRMESSWKLALHQQTPV
jgi:hypothetical protein